jgi:FkbM family methyltransferase
MRAELLYNPRLLVERVAELSLERRRCIRLRETPGAQLRGVLLDSLELLELVPSTPHVIYDIGANTGTWTLLAKSVHPCAHVFAFEPLGWHCREYLQASARLQNVTLHQVALGSVTGRLDMYVPNQSDSASLLQMASACEDVFNLKFDKCVAVTVERLDDYVQKHNLPMPDLIKLDVQGYECEVLRGGTRILEHAKAIITEVSFKEFYRGQCRFDQLVSFLAEAGLFTYAFGLRTPMGKPLQQCDMLFLRSP